MMSSVSGGEMKEVQSVVDYRQVCRWKGALPVRLEIRNFYPLNRHFVRVPTDSVCATFVVGRTNALVRTRIGTVGISSSQSDVGISIAAPPLE